MHMVIELPNATIGISNVTAQNRSISTMRRTPAVIITSFNGVEVTATVNTDRYLSQTSCNIITIKIP